jgi:hypothetical protein
MGTRVEIRHHRICADPTATFTLPAAWHRLLEAGADGIDEVGLSELGSGLVDPAARAGYSSLVAPRLSASRLAGATFGATMAGDGDVPVAASVLVSPLKATPTSVAQLEVEWRAASPRDFTRVSLPVGPALVGSIVRDVEVDELSSVSVYDWQAAIPHPDRGGLLLAFSTPLAELKQMFDEVFLAIVRTVRWQRDWRS